MKRRPSVRRLVQWSALGVFGSAAPLACSGAFDPAEVLGIWNTQSINGHAVPGSVVYEGISYDTEYVRWTFYEGGLCTLTQRVDGVTATYDDCEYTVDAERAAVAMVLLSEVWDGTVEGTRMAFSDPKDVVWILRAQ